MKQAQAVIASDKSRNQNALERWRHLFNDEMQAVNKVILRMAHDNQVPLIGQLADHIIASGGKRLRPTLSLLSTKMCGYEGDKHIDLAAAIEFLHTATLLHDDVVDESKLRRGKLTANETWGNAASVLVGDFLLSRAFQLMTGSGNIRVLEILSDTSVTISEGEVDQLTTLHNINIDTDKYLQIVRDKTAKLFSAACEVGAVMGEKGKKEQKAMEDYGMNLGMAFQIVDDVLDYSAKQEQLGKTIGDDLNEGKVTLPVILAYEKGDAGEKEFWRSAIEDEPRDKKNVSKAIMLIESHRVLDEAMARATEFAEKAKTELKIFPESDYRQALLDLADFSVNRPY